MLPFLFGRHKQTRIVTVLKVVEAHREADRFILKSDKRNDAVIDARPVELLHDARMVRHQDVSALEQLRISNPEQVRLPGVQHTLPDSHLVCPQEPHLLILSPGARRGRRARRYRGAVTQRPDVVCLCGSATFMAEVREANRELTLEGVIVLAPSEADESPTAEQKAFLGALHLHKIDLADRVLVVNPGGYVGESTQKEIAYARAAGKPVTFTDPH